MAKWASAATAYAADRAAIVTGLGTFCKSVAMPVQTNQAQHTARQAFDPLAESARGLVKQIDLLYKLAAPIRATGARAGCKRRSRRVL